MLTFERLEIGDIAIIDSTIGVLQGCMLMQTDRGWWLEVESVDYYRLDMHDIAQILQQLMELNRGHMPEPEVPF